MTGDTREVGTISVDVDPIDIHLRGYRVNDCAPDASVYERAVPRLLEHFGAAGARATFFFVARDAAAHAACIREVVEAGHEVASHTVSHPADFGGLGREALREELVGSLEALEQAGGAPVVGFRAPGWGQPAGLIEELEGAGYRYDASAFPTPILGLARIVLWARSRPPRERFILDAGGWFGPRAPGRLAGSTLQRFPLSTTRSIRWPVYHTVRYNASDAGFEKTIASLSRERHPLSYALHAVDALGLAEDGIDPRMSRHPGLALPLDQKRALLDRTLETIAAAYRTVPYSERLLDAG